MEKLTAVEWLIEEWSSLKFQLPPWLIEKVIKMEKEQIIDATRIARQDDFWEKYKSYEDYYNTTFKKYYD
jgi:hypothetical protein